MLYYLLFGFGVFVCQTVNERFVPRAVTICRWFAWEQFR